MIKVKVISDRTKQPKVPSDGTQGKGAESLP